MGTNYYLTDRKSTHIGKRCAAGLWCWDCNVTLQASGLAGIHQSNKWPGAEVQLSRCPKCGKPATERSFTETTGGVELGFAKSEDVPRHGVSTCCSFSWAMRPEELPRRVKAFRKQKPIQDEYGHQFSFEEFQKEMGIVTIEFTHSIGLEFS